MEYYALETLEELEGILEGQIENVCLEGVPASFIIIIDESPEDVIDLYNARFCDTIIEWRVAGVDAYDIYITYNR